MSTALRCLPGNQQLIGESPSFRAEVEKVHRVARFDASVLISGETGTGKELCAHAIHSLSPRARKPFVAVNCGAIPVELVENELFGHKAGAYTDASTLQRGLVFEADGGTLFLDEIVCLPALAQIKLLRFLQEKEYRPLGSTKTLQADVRVIAASNIEPERAVAEGTLARNLYYRLNVVPIRLSPLRERREDISLLARHFLGRYSAKFNKQATNFSPEATELLALYDWPGNVRELEHVVQRAVILARRAVIQCSDIALPGTEISKGREPFKVAKAKTIAKFEKDYITKLLHDHHGNITRAAQVAQKNRRAFWELIRKYRIDVQRFRPFRAY